MAPRVLVVEDTEFYGPVLKKQIELECHFDTTWVKSHVDAKGLIDNQCTDFIIAVLDYNLPDAPNGEVIDHALSRNMPVIVLTEELSNNSRSQMWSKNIVDYVLKNNQGAVLDTLNIIKHFYRHRTRKVLVVDDSAMNRQYIAKLLHLHQYDVFEVESGREALRLLEKQHDIKLVITDTNMPEMNGFELSQNIREKFGRRKLAIIGLSAHDDNLVTAQFLKNGANDFLAKPFSSEEFYCRVTQNMNVVEYETMIEDAAYRDFLTGLHNRRFFYDMASKYLAQSKRHNHPVAVALLDVDHFKKINETYGYDIGDEVLRTIGSILKDRFRESDLVARMGGEGFAIFLHNVDPESVGKIFEDLRVHITETPVNLSQGRLQITVSIGVCALMLDSIEEFVKEANGQLFESKNQGRNRVTVL